MGRYIIKRLFETVIILLIIAVIAFSIIHLIPGDPIYSMLGTDITQEYHDQVAHEMGLDRPLLSQFFFWLGNFCKGELGYSYYYKQPVATVVANRLPITLYLGLISAVLSVILGILSGVITAVKRGKLADSILTVLANIGIAMPSFWLAVLLIWFFGLKLKILPTHSFVLPWVDLKLSLKQGILPVICMSVGGIASYTRQTRSSMLEVIGQDYIRTARSKGLGEGRIVRRHAIKNALIPVLTLIGMTLRGCIGGSAIIETVFNINGLGRVMVAALTNRDYTTLQTGLVLLALITCLCNLAVDIAYAYVDPRIRLK